MAARYHIIDHDTPMLLPPSLRDRPPPDHLVHVIMDAVEELDLGRARVNPRGSGDAQYPPGMLLALLIHSYATGTFSSRQIERNSHDHVAVRYLCGDTHPDHVRFSLRERPPPPAFFAATTSHGSFCRTQSDRLLEAVTN